MSKPVYITVPGVPLTKGSQRHVTSATTGKAVPAPDKPEKRRIAWENTVKVLAMQQWNRPPLGREVPIVLCIDFEFVRPKSVSAKKRPEHIVKPDLDKLARAVLDGLIGVVFVDDSQVVTLILGKEYADAPAAKIMVRVEE